MRIKLDIPLTLNKIADMCGGCLRRNDAVIEYISTASYECQAGDLFFPLLGEKFDGRNYIPEAKKNGAYIITNIKSADVHFCGATNSMLLRLASSYKDIISPRTTIAITGSNGKTTTKNFILKMLGRKFNVHGTRENENNEIGLSFSLLSMKKNTDVAVFELGMNHPGEIRKMSEAINPSVAIITNVGNAHIGNFDNIESIAKAKLEIESGLRGGYTVVSKNENLLSGAKNPYFVSFSGESCNLSIKYIHIGENKSEIRLKTRTDEFTLTTPLFQREHIYDLCYAVAVCDILGLSADEIVKCSLAITPEDLRGRLIEENGYTFYDDSYNASPESSIASIKMIAEKYKRFSVLFGDMLELGRESERFHKKIGNAIAENGALKLYAFGKYSDFIAEGAKNGGIPSKNIFINRNIDMPELTAKTIKDSYDGEMLLVKASHLINIKRIIDLLIRKGNNDA